MLIKTTTSHGNGLKNEPERIEVVFARLFEQMMLKKNYTKTFEGLRIKIMSKVASVTVPRYINHLNGKPPNNIKHALAA